MRIEITLKNYRCFADRHPAKIVIEDGLTAFVGVNNAGKSTLLRFLYEFRNLFSAMAADSNWREAARTNRLSVSIPSSIRDSIELYSDTNERDMTLEFRVTGDREPPRNVPEIADAEFKFPRNDRVSYILTRIESPAIGRFPLGTEVDLASAAELGRGDVRVSLRNHLEAMRRLSRTLYVGAFRNVLNTGAKTDYFDIQVGDAFIRRWRAMQTGNQRQENTACLKVEAKVAELLGYKTLSIQAADSNDTLHVVADGRPYKLHELGSGLAQCILVLVNAAVVRPGYILIDEPELHLHPSLQLDFLTALGEFAEYGTLFSTHSIGLARAAAQRIYSVTRQDGFSQVKELEELRNLPEFLGALSYSSYHALGFDKVLLVEGTTEVLAIQRLLRKVGKEHRILLLPLGGSALINGNRSAELSEMKRITPNIFALIDSEKDFPTAKLSRDREQFCKTCAELPISCHVLERRALENYLMEKAIKQVKGDKYRPLTAFEKLTDANPSWGKHENWRIIGEMDWDDVKDTDLGDFLAKL